MAGIDRAMLHHRFEFESRVPAWLRPTCRGAVCLLGLGAGAAGRMYVLALIVSLVLITGIGPGLGVFADLVAVVVVSGAVGGSAFGLVASFTPEWPKGQWLRWFVALFTAQSAAILLTPRGPFSLEDPVVLFMATVVAALAALLRVLMEERRSGRPTPHQYRWLVNRERRSNGWVTGSGVPRLTGQYVTPARVRAVQPALSQAEDVLVQDGPEQVTALQVPECALVMALQPLRQRAPARSGTITGCIQARRPLESSTRART